MVEKRAFSRTKHQYFGPFFDLGTMCVTRASVARGKFPRFFVESASGWLTFREVPARARNFPEFCTFFKTRFAKQKLIFWSFFHVFRTFARARNFREIPTFFPEKHKKWGFDVVWFLQTREKKFPKKCTFFRTPKMVKQRQKRDFFFFLEKKFPKGLYSPPVGGGGAEFSPDYKNLKFRARTLSPKKIFAHPNYTILVYLWITRKVFFSTFLDLIGKNDQKSMFLSVILLFFSTVFRTNVSIFRVCVFCSYMAPYIGTHIGARKTRPKSLFLNANRVFSAGFFEEISPKYCVLLRVFAK